jgi:hypothetical protein
MALQSNRIPASETTWRRVKKEYFRLFIRRVIELSF